MKLEKSDISEFVGAFYFFRAISGLRKAQEYSEQVLAKVLLADIVALAVLFLWLLTSHPGRNWTIAGFGSFFAFHLCLFRIGRKRTEKRFSDLTPSSSKLETQVDRALSDIANLDEIERAMLQSLIDARNNKEAFHQKLKEASRFRKLEQLEFLQEVAGWTTRGQQTK